MTSASHSSTMPSEDTTSSSVVWEVYSLASSAVVLCLTIFFVLRPLHFTPSKLIPTSSSPSAQRLRWLKYVPTLSLDYATAPIFGCLALVVLGLLRWTNSTNTGGILGGLRGSDTIQPYAIIVIFFGLAYISVSFDVTGAFEWLALVAIKRGGGRGRKLFLYLWLVTTVVTITASNDVAVLTLTPILCHFTKAAGIDPVPLLLTCFFASNIWSMTLLIGNPTNIIVGLAYRMTFLEYTAWMGIPAALCGITHLGLMWIMVRKHVPEQLSTTNSSNKEPSQAIRSKFGALFGCVGLTSCIVLMCMSHWIGVSLWVLCGVYWLLYLTRDFSSDLFYSFISSSKQSPSSPSTTSTVKFEVLKEEQSPSATATKADDDDDTVENDEEQQQQPPKHEQEQQSNCPEAITKVTTWCQDKFPTVAEVMGRMPWKILPFVLGMFIFVQCLKDVGWVTRAAKLIAAVPSQPFGLTVLISGVASAALALVINNQPMTILCTMVLQEAGPLINNAATEKAWSMGLILGSNLCANYTIFGALAGIMWLQIINNHGIDSSVMSSAKFSKYGFITMPLVTLLGCAILIVELWVFPHFSFFQTSSVEQQTILSSFQ